MSAFLRVVHFCSVGDAENKALIIICVISSAVKRLKYLIAINRIYVIVNSKLIAINRNFLSILNVPSFMYFFHHFILILMPLSTWKSGLACFMQMFYLIENQHCQTGRYKIKLESAHFR